MSNLKRQVAEIQKRLAVSHAEMIARLKKSETDFEELRTVVERLATGQKELRQAFEDQSNVQQAALEQLLELVAEDQARQDSRLDAVEERVTRLEQDRPPAA